MGFLLIVTYLIPPFGVAWGWLFLRAHLACESPITSLSVASRANCTTT